MKYVECALKVTNFGICIKLCYFLFSLAHVDIIIGLMFLTEPMVIIKQSEKRESICDITKYVTWFVYIILSKFDPLQLCNI